MSNISCNLLGYMLQFTPRHLLLTDVRTVIKKKNGNLDTEKILWYDFHMWNNIKNRKRNDGKSRYFRHLQRSLMKLRRDDERDIEDGSWAVCQAERF